MGPSTRSSWSYIKEEGNSFIHVGFLSCSWLLYVANTPVINHKDVTSSLALSHSTTWGE